MLFSRQKSLGGSPFPVPSLATLYPDQKVRKMAQLAKSGDVESMFQMGIHHSNREPPDIGMALIYFRDAARHGHYQSKISIVNLLMDGFDNPLQSFSLFCVVLQLNIRHSGFNDLWFQSEVNDGSFTFKFLYCIGLLSLGTIDKILEMQINDACAGSKLAMGILGWMHDDGKAVPQNFIRAYSWYNLAAALGLNSARIDRDRIAEKLSTSQLAEAQKHSSETYNLIFVTDT